MRIVAPLLTRTDFSHAVRKLGFSRVLDVAKRFEQELDGKGRHLTVCEVRAMRPVASRVVPSRTQARTLTRCTSSVRAGAGSVQGRRQGGAHVDGVYLEDGYLQKVADALVAIHGLVRGRAGDCGRVIAGGRVRGRAKRCSRAGHGVVHRRRSPAVHARAQAVWFEGERDTIASAWDLALVWSHDEKEQAAFVNDRYSKALIRLLPEHSQHKGGYTDDEVERFSQGAAGATTTVVAKLPPRRSSSSEHRPGAPLAHLALAHGASLTLRAQGACTPAARPSTSPCTRATSSSCPASRWTRPPS